MSKLRPAASTASQPVGSRLGAQGPARVALQIPIGPGEQHAVGIVGMGHQGPTVGATAEDPHALALEDGHGPSEIVHAKRHQVQPGSS